LAKIAARFGAPSGLVNNAALDSPPDSPASETGPFEGYPESSWDRVMDVNAKGVFLCCQIFGEAMAKAGRGSIVNVASIYGTVSPDQNLYEYRRQQGETFYKPVAYAASKSALYNLTRYIAVYWGPKNVRANTVTFAGVFNKQDPRFLERYKLKIPLRRGPADEAKGGMADPSDYIGVAVFLLSDASAYMTGADLRVDGGFLAL
jgi:NAD(P)-dependent dehydrogenase (short-subunit alcohol dehydrogenase family)